MYDMIELAVIPLVAIQVVELIGLLLHTKEYRKALKEQVDQNKRLIHRIWQLLEDNTELRKENSRMRVQIRGLTERRED